MGVLRFLLVGDVREELRRHSVFTQLLINGDQQPLGRGVHVAHFHPSLVVKEDVVALARSVDAHIKLLLLRPTERNTDSSVMFIDLLCTVTPKFFSLCQRGLQMKHTAVRSACCSRENILLPAG